MFPSVSTTWATVRSWYASSSAARASRGRDRAAGPMHRVRRARAGTGGREPDVASGDPGGRERRGLPPARPGPHDCDPRDGPGGGQSHDHSTSPAHPAIFANRPDAARNGENWAVFVDLTKRSSCNPGRRDPG